LQLADEFEGSYGDRIRTMLFPYQFDTCSPKLLKATSEAARDRGLIVHMHAAQYLYEFRESVRRYGKTPIQFLHDIGFLGPDVILTHVLFTTSHPDTGYPRGDTRDIDLLSESGATLAHCPVVFSLAGQMLHSFDTYRRAGVNIAMAIEAFPVDMIKAMRTAAVLGKIAEHDRAAVTARHVFDAATLAGARGLGRDDLGRLAPGAKADILIVDMTGLHLGLLDDPIKKLVYMCSQRDIEKVIIGGEVIVEAGRVKGIDEEVLAKKAREINQGQKQAYAAFNPQGKTAEELFPPSYPMEGEGV
jgi:cytosine/adenosine deaminase-related metal-dependent hydrolase